MAHLCTQCGESFSGISTFDAHHDWPGGYEPIICLDPLELGYSTDHLGVWGNRGTYKERDTDYVPAAERPAHEYERECARCGNIFMRPRRRGRPPKYCEDCRE